MINLIKDIWFIFFILENGISFHSVEDAYEFLILHIVKIYVPQMRLLFKVNTGYCNNIGPGTTGKIENSFNLNIKIKFIKAWIYNLVYITFKTDGTYTKSLHIGNVKAIKPHKSI